MFLIMCTGMFGQTPVPILPGERPSSSKSDLIINRMGSMNNLSSGDLFTGSANITVPFYEQHKNNINLGVSLHFNTKGVKVDEHSGNYGLHWGLSGGGYILKYINDIEDETRTAFDESFMIFGSSTTYDMAYGKLELSKPPVSAKGYRDKEYDEYHVSVGGYGFKFYIDGSNNFFVSPQHDVKIRKEGNDFLITDIYGNCYLFKKSVDIDNKKFVANASYGGSYDNTMEFPVPQRVWVLEQVTFPNKETVSFTYLTYSNAYYLYRYGMNAIEMGSGYQASLNRKESGPELPILKEVVYSNHDSLVLDYHTFNRCDLGSTPLLDKVKLYRNNHPVPVHYYQLHYSYVVSDANKTRLYFNSSANCNLVSNAFTSGDYSDEKKMLYYRVQLDSVNYHVSQNSFLPYYKFEYYNHEHLPPRLSARQDYWGYYNGKNTDFPDNLLPDALDASGLDKTLDVDKMRVGNIKKVTNGLGQVNEYRYDIADAYPDLHVQTSQPLSIAVSNPDPGFSGKLTGLGVIATQVYDGLRLTEFITSDPTMPGGNTLRKKFDYRGGMQFLAGGRWSTRGHQYDDLIYASHRFSAGHQISGSNIGYSYVREETFNAAQELLSSQETRFSNVVNYLGNNVYENNYVTNGNTHYFQPPYTNKSYLKDYRIGLKLSEKSYDNLGHIINEKQYKYTYQEDIFTPASHPLNIHVQYRDYMNFYHTTDPMYIGGKGDSIFVPKFVDTYTIFSGKALLQEIKDINYYTDSRTTSDITAYTYDNKGNLLTETSRKESDLHFYVKQFYYPKDFLSATAPETRNIAQGLIDRNILNEVGYTITRKTTSGTQNYPYLVTDGAFSTYTATENGDLYVKATSGLKKGNRSAVSVAADLEKPHAELLMTTVQDLAGYRAETQVTRVNEWLLPLELRHRGVNKYSTIRYNNIYKTDVAACNTKYKDFIFLSFENGADAEGVMYDDSKLSGFAQAGPRFDYPQSGTGMLKMVAGDRIKVNEMSGNRKYVVSCWVTKAGPEPPQAMTVTSSIGTVELQLSQNHWLRQWYYFQGEIDLGDRDWLEIAYDGTVNTWVDNLVIAPAGATYTIKSFNIKGMVDMEGTLNGKQVRYEYDAFNRLKVTRDENGNIKETFNYHISR